ncbi:sulfatase [Planctomycetales bacterium ZRK34]|nr:sulfatase [Planctomycetales bacterium ZRK34]
MKRLSLLVVVAAALMGGFFMRPVMVQAAAPRPNVVFILVDDLAYDALGFMGRYPFLKTPHIDQLAKEGAWFRNAFVTISLCSPSRSAFLTGMYAHNTGVPTNERCEIPPDMPTFPSQLQKAGYSTAFIGKWHMLPRDDPRPGFDHWVSFKGQGVYFDPKLNVDGKPVNREGYITDLLTDYATAWLDKQAGKDKPFCLYLSHKAVHGPFTPAKRHAHEMDDVELAVPESFLDDMADKPRWMRRNAWGAMKPGRVPDKLPQKQWPAKRKDRLGYLGAILAVDECVGRVMDTLKKIDRLDDTIVMFTSDNGFFMGEHRRGDKRLAYEESMRIPMIVRYPAKVKSGSVIDAMTLNIDIAPTFMQLGGAEIPDGVQGRSLVPVLDGSTPDNWRQAFLYEYFRERHFNQTPTLLAVRTERYKYIIATDEKDDIAELYDLQKDPKELESVINDPQYADVLAMMKSKLNMLKQKTGYHVPDILKKKPADRAPRPGKKTAK